ncbi:hypothetical protein EDB84DRAFT_1501201 [Lactarius hengduanensis]|nr:hypothetical protein EDB84DRAFT_1501201 [Lactarius hengduanensis]
MKSHKRSRLVSHSPRPRGLALDLLTSTSRSLSSSLQSWSRRFSTSQLLPPTRTSFGARIKTPAAVGTAPSRHPIHATPRHNDFGSDSSPPASHASFSTPVASLQVQVSKFQLLSAVGTRRHSPAQVEDMQRLHHARRYRHSRPNRQSRFRPRRTVLKFQSTLGT